MRHKAGDRVDARIINTTSHSALFANVGQANYASAKAGVATLTQLAARELSRYGVPANAIAPRANRSEERRVGKEYVSQYNYRWSPYNYKKKNKNTRQTR